MVSKIASDSETLKLRNYPSILRTRSDWSSAIKPKQGEGISKRAAVVTEAKQQFILE
jgi:hypothetical protein